MNQSLRRRFSIYLSALWLLVAGLSLAHLIQRPQAYLYLIPLELGLFTLFIYGLHLVRQIFEPIELLGQTTRLLAEGEFTMRLRAVGQPEVDHLIQIYNRMSEQLQREKVFNLEQEYFLEKVLRETTSGIITFDYDGNLERTNPAAAKLLGKPEQELMGCDPTTLESPLARALVALSTGQERIVGLPDGRRIKAVRSHFMDRGFQRDFIFVDELTAALRETEKEAYGKLIRIMSHEINNSIGAANSLLHSLLKYQDQIHSDDRNDFRNALEVVVSRTEHLKAFMSDYAAVIKLPKPTLTQVELTSILDHVLELMKADLNAARIQVTRQASGPANIRADRFQMEQVLLNIIKNAAEAIGEDGEILICVEQREQRLVCYVEDNGGGISATTEHSVFTPFFTTKPSGQGIGLTLTGEILHNHNAGFALETCTPGKARFTIWF